MSLCCTDWKCRRNASGCRGSTSPTSSPKPRVSFFGLHLCYCCLRKGYSLVEVSSKTKASLHKLCIIKLRRSRSIFDSLLCLCEFMQKAWESKTHSSAEIQVGDFCFLISSIHRRCQLKSGQLPCAVCPEFLIWPWCHKCFRTTWRPMLSHMRACPCDRLTAEPSTAGLGFVRLATAFPLTVLLCSETYLRDICLRSNQRPPSLRSCCWQWITHCKYSTPDAQATAVWRE